MARNKLTEGNLVLYRKLKHCKENNLQFSKEDAVDIYVTHIKPERYKQFRETQITDTVYSNANAWLDRAIACLIKRGYLGLTFNMELEKQLELRKEIENGN